MHSVSVSSKNVKIVAGTLIEKPSPEKSNQSGLGLFGPAGLYQMSCQSYDCLNAYQIGSGRRSIRDKFVQLFFQNGGSREKRKRILRLFEQRIFN